MCFTRHLHLKDAKSVPEGQNSSATAMDADFEASAKEEAGSANPIEVRTLAIICKPREADRRVLGDFCNG